MQVKDAVSAEAVILCRTQISDLKSKLGCLMELMSEHVLENKHLSLVNKLHGVLDVNVEYRMCKR